MHWFEAAEISPRLDKRLYLACLFLYQLLIVNQVLGWKPEQSGGKLGTKCRLR
jgi:hypothetical protein